MADGTSTIASRSTRAARFSVCALHWARPLSWVHNAGWTQLAACCRSRAGSAIGARPSAAAVLMGLFNLCLLLAACPLPALGYGSLLSSATGTWRVDGSPCVRGAASAAGQQLFGSKHAADWWMRPGVKGVGSAQLWRTGQVLSTAAAVRSLSSALAGGFVPIHQLVSPSRIAASACRALAPLQLKGS